jgi:hypothetical protein
MISAQPTFVIRVPTPPDAVLIPGQVPIPTWPSPYEFSPSLGQDGSSLIPTIAWFAAAAGAATGAYHGYKRNQSVGWALGWALAGFFLPIVTIPVSIAQGFGKRKR